MNLQCVAPVHVADYRIGAGAGRACQGAVSVNENLVSVFSAKNRIFFFPGTAFSLSLSKFEHSFDKFS